MPELDFSPLLEKLNDFPFDWDGKQCILALKKANFQWKQMEWIGWYLEFLCRNRLCPPLTFPGPNFGNVQFDGLWSFPWDFKAHVTTNRKGNRQYGVIVNDQDAIRKAIEEYGSVGLIVATGEAEFNDEDRSFQQWHSELKGGKSAYEQERISRGASSRFRKVAFNVDRYSLYLIDGKSITRLKDHHQGRNSDGSPRAPKFMLNLREFEPAGEVTR